VKHSPNPVTNVTVTASRYRFPLRGWEAGNGQEQRFRESVGNGRKRSEAVHASGPLPPSTWILYPDPDQVPVREAGKLVARLHRLGVEVEAQPDGVFAVTGPDGWFTDDNRRELRRRVAGIVAFLDASKGADHAAA